MTLSIGRRRLTGMIAGSALVSLDFVTPLGTRVHFKNPPDGENLDPTVVCAQVTGRGTYAVI